MPSIILLATDAVVQTTLSPEELFERWKEVEKVAMHFNELILDFRIKAIGVLAIVSGIGSMALGKTPDGKKETAFQVSFYLLLFLIGVWISCFLLDVYYYNNLLGGAVKEAIRLESLSSLGVTLSTEIKNNFSSGHIWPRYVFYLIPLVMMCLGAKKAHTLSKANN